MFLSVIVPVYNVERYLAECLTSIVEQDFDDFEVICVNDGSTDGSAVILNQFANKYPKVNVINQENRGLSGARNTGMRFVKGDWIWFVDSDDYIKEGAIKSLYNMATQNVDIVSFNVELVFEDTPEKKHKMNQITHTMQCSGKEYLALAKYHEAFSVVWQRIYRTSFLKTNEFHFYEGIIHEDVLFSSLVCATVRQVIVTSEVFYVYRRRNGSILTKAGQSEKHAMSMAVVGNELFRP